MDTVAIFTDRFTVSGYRDKRRPFQLLRAGAYGNVTPRVENFVYRLLSGSRRRPDTIDLEYVTFDFDPKTNEVLEEFARLGLVPPTAEDALRFGERYPEEQLAGPIAFLHTPWSDRRDWKNVLCLDTWNGKRTLRGPSILSRWSGRHRFVGRRP